MSQTPKVSIIIPAYNVAGYIADTLASVFKQTFTDFEVIIVNDGSPDTAALEQAISGYSGRIKYLKHDNIGAGAARNVGIKQARGELLAFLDGDDIWFPEYLESQVRFLTEGDHDLVYADALLFGGSPYDGQRYSDGAPSTGSATFEALLGQSCSVITSGTVVRTKCVIDAGMFEAEKLRAHDFVLWLRIANAGGRIAYQRKVLLKYRIRPDSLTGNSQQRVQREIDVYGRILRLFHLSQAQLRIVEKRTDRLRIEMQIELGKSRLLSRDFSGARAAFIEANRQLKSAKLAIVIVTLAYAPRLVLMLYKTVRQRDIAFISPTDE